MITLDHVQSLALRKAATAPVDATGRAGTGKSTLANAIATEAARSGRTCLLVGASPVLDQPLGYSIVGDIHRVLTDRAQLNHPSLAAPVERPPRDLQTSPFAARARSNPAAARAALRTLQKAQQISEAHGITPEEVETSVALSRELSQAAINSLSLATQDAARIADMLWTGNARTGRTFKDVEEAVSGRPADVPFNEEAMSLILSSDQDYERDLVKLVSGRQEAREEREASAAVASLLRPRSSGKTLSEYHRYASFMARTTAIAITLIKRQGNLKAALAAAAGNDAAKAIDYYMRMRPDQGAAAATRTFEAALQDYRRDVAVLEPLLQEFGSRTLASFKPEAPHQDGLPPRDIGSLVQKLREARYAARHLPAHLATLKRSLSKSLFERVRSGPIEDAAKTATGASAPDPRAKAATELRHLRELFASMGFGDMYEAPPDFAAMVEGASSLASASPDEPAQSYDPDILDLLLELTAVEEVHAAPAWPAAVIRVRNAQDAAETIRRHGRFDVAVIDDAADMAEGPRKEIEDAAALVHRLGSSADDSMVLEIPHRQTDAAVAAAASGQSGRWTGSPNGVGVVIRADPALGTEQMTAAAGDLVARLRESGSAAFLWPDTENADIVVRVLDTLRDADLTETAAHARNGIVVFCQTSELSSPVRADSRMTPDLKDAVALGWKIFRSAIEGTVLEKDGRLALLVYEAAAVSPRDETVADVSRRLEGFGWRPIVTWNGTQRSADELEMLLASHSIARMPDPAVEIISAFDPQGFPPPDGPPKKPDEPLSETEASAETAAADAAPPPGDEMAAPASQKNEASNTAVDDALWRFALRSDVAEAPAHAGTPADTGDPSEAGESGPERIPVAVFPGDGEDARTEAGSQDAAVHDFPVEIDGAVDREEPDTAFAFAGSSTVFKDRRGARRAAPRDPDGPRPERRAAPRPRQAEARIRLVIDRRQKNVRLAGVLSRPDGFPEEIDVRGETVEALSESRYSDIELDWTLDFLRGEFRLSDQDKRLEWMRSARRIHLFASAAGEADLLTISAAKAGTEYSIACMEADAAAVEEAAGEAGSPSLLRLEDFEGIPAGWAIFEGYIPTRAAPGLAEWLKPLDPGAAIQIVFRGGLKIRASAFADAEPPSILIEGLPSNCEVSIGGAPAAKQEDGTWSAPGWDQAGKHLVDIEPGPSESYEIVADPALGSGWEPWRAHEFLASPLAGSASSCGAMIFSPDGRIVLATEPASSVTALGTHHEMQGLVVRRDAPAALGSLPFEPLFVIVSSNGRRNSKILVLNHLSDADGRKPAKLDGRWIAKVRDVSARRVPIRPQTPAAQAAWRSAAREARRWRRTR